MSTADGGFAQCELRSKPVGGGLAVPYRGRVSSYDVAYYDDVASRRFVLRYGESRSLSRFRCTSRSTGMTCRNRVTHSGFTTSRQAQTIFRPVCASRLRLAGEGRYFLEVTVTGRHLISCSAAKGAGRPLWRADRTGLPTRSYPPPPAGVPGGKRKPFHLSAPTRGFTCRMLYRGSDFAIARCRRGRAVFRIYDHHECCLSARAGHRAISAGIYHRPARLASLP